MEFKEINFNCANEADVREEIITPLLRGLGYKTGADSYIIREQPLRYPRIQLGRKNQNKDPLLRGRVDYICGIKDGPLWTIEAKNPSADICIDDIEQTYSYANHPEVRAVYFCITNGKKFVFYQTNQGPAALPILEVLSNKLEESFVKVSNLVAPESLIRDHGKTHIDTGNPLGTGLRSIGRISNGFIKYTEASIPVPVLLEMITTIRYGSIERDEDDRLSVYLETITPFQSLQEFNEKLGLHKLEIKSNDSVLSSDPQRPTQFEATQSAVLPAGMPILDVLTWKHVAPPVNIYFDAQTVAIGYLKGNKFLGEFRVILFYKNSGKKVSLKGNFEILIT